MGTETVKIRFGEFEFKNSYPAADSARRRAAQNEIVN
jgi:hypothetical protein